MQKKQREILNSINNNLSAEAESKDEQEMEATDAEVSSLLSSNGSVFKVQA